MIRLLIVLALVSSAWAGQCDVLDVKTQVVPFKDTTVTDTTAMVQDGTSIYVCMNSGQVRNVNDNADRLRKDLDTAKDLLELRALQKLKSDTAYTLMVKADSVMTVQVDTLMKVIAVTDTINSNLKYIRTYKDTQLERCEESKMTFLEKAGLAAGMFILGGLVGVLIN